MFADLTMAKKRYTKLQKPPAPQSRGEWVVKSLHLNVPAGAPYDQQDTWFETFIGTNIRPLIRRHKFKRFWFTRYGVAGAAHMRFRFQVRWNDRIKNDISNLIAKFTLAQDGFGDYNPAGDLGEGQDSRFLGPNTTSNKERRGRVAFDFVHATSRLFLDSLEGPDAQGYFHREAETKSNFNIEGPLEQFHHLYCNITESPTYVWTASHPSHGNAVEAPGQISKLLKADPLWQFGQQIRIHY